MPNDFGYRIRLALGLDSREAEESLRRLGERARRELGEIRPGGPAARPALPGLTPADVQSVTRRLEEQGYGGIEQRRALRLLGAEETQRLRELRREEESLRGIRDDHARRRRRALQEQIQQQERLVYGIRQMRRASEALAFQERHMFQERSRWAQSWQRVHDRMYGMSMGQAIQGGGLSALFGGLGRGIMANPILGTAILVAGAGVGGLMLAESGARRSEDIELLYLNLARRVGQRNARSLLELPSGRPRSFSRLAFTGAEVAQVESVYGMPIPADALRPTEEMLRFARRFGFGQAPQAIAGMARMMTQIGVEPAVQTQFWRQMTEAVKRGQQEGTDASDTMKGILNALTGLAMRTGLVGVHEQAGIAAMLSTLGHGGRFFLGERGAQHMMRLFEGIQNPQALEARMLILSGLKREFGGQLPVARTLGLQGEEARVYEMLPEQSKAEFIMQNMYRFIGAPRGIRAQIGRVLEGLGRNLSPQVQFFALQRMTGMTTAQLVQALAAINRAIQPKAEGAGNVAILGARQEAPFSVLGALFRHQQGKASPYFREFMQILSSNAPLPSTVQVSEVEKARANVQSVVEMVSRQVSKETLDLRASVKEGVAEGLSNFIIDMSKAMTGISTLGDKGIMEILDDIYDLIKSLVPFGSTSLRSITESVMGEQRTQGLAEYRLKDLSDLRFKDLFPFDIHSGEP